LEEIRVTEELKQQPATPLAGSVTYIRSDKECAAEIRDAVKALMIEVGRWMDQANARGMRVEFQMVIDGFGKNTLGRLDVTKALL
jgi:hypothetical protein